MHTKTAIILAAGIPVLVLAFLNRPARRAPVPLAEPREPLTTKPVFKLRRPAPAMPVAARVAEPHPDGASSTNLLIRLLDERCPLKLSAEQVESYLRANRRNAESLLAAFQITGDGALLREALEKYPADPRVSLAASLAALKSDTLSPEQRRQRLEKFEEVDPQNALANYLSALDHFRSGQTEQAVEELIAASGKSKVQNYSGAHILAMEEAYHAAGYSEAEAKAAADLEWPGTFIELRSLVYCLADLATAYQQAGDKASAEAVFRIGANMGQQVAQQPRQELLGNDIMGRGIEGAMLGGVDPPARQGLDPASAYGDSGHTVKDRLDELKERSEEYRLLRTQVQDLLPTLPEQDLVSFFDRKRIFGEIEALQWARNKVGKQ